MFNKILLHFLNKMFQIMSLNLFENTNENESTTGHRNLQRKWVNCIWVIRMIQLIAHFLLFCFLFSAEVSDSHHHSFFPKVLFHFCCFNLYNLSAVFMWKALCIFISDPLLLQFMKSFNSRLLILCRLIWFQW